MKFLEQQWNAKGLEISQDQILGEGHYSNPQDQALYEHSVSLYNTTALHIWERIQEPRNRIESYIRVKQDNGEPFSDFLRRLTKTV